MKEYKFEKVIEYQYPNGERFEGSKYEFYLSMLIFWLIWIIGTNPSKVCSPFTFKDSDYFGHRKVYYRRTK